jgi:hypothetical protein
MKTVQELRQSELYSNKKSVSEETLFLFVGYSLSSCTGGQDITFDFHF